MAKKIALPTDPHYHNEVLLEPEKILCNDVQLPGEPHRGHTKLWVVFNAHGAMGAVWAGDVEEALDVLVDADLAQGILCDADTLTSMTESEQEGLTPLGNNGQLADLTDVQVVEVKWNPSREKDLSLLLKFAEARGAGADTLDDL